MSTKRKSTKEQFEVTPSISPGTTVAKSWPNSSRNPSLWNHRQTAKRVEQVPPILDRLEHGFKNMKSILTFESSEDDDELFIHGNTLWLK
jgi:hypothetical protein